MDKKVEQRHCTRAIATANDSRRVEGYALLFDCNSVNLGGFTERIAPEAMNGVLERSDILALLDHRQERGVLARYRMGTGSLELEVDDIGLRYAFDAPHTALGDEVLEGLKRGDISSSSFAFDVEGEKWEKLDDGTYMRTITQFGKLYDVSPVYYPAYPDTSVAARSLDAFKAQEQAAAEAQAQAEAEARAAEIDAYIEELKLQIV